ncbi:hypothetical protein FDUTEX481_05585 [Tolypothrix sp. PCC 7601]|nr:hypothetical protein FDUTEX481_05585 [Tolypothrix sp. PCC 7601]
MIDLRNCQGSRVKSQGSNIYYLFLSAPCSLPPCLFSIQSLAFGVLL